MKKIVFVLSIFFIVTSCENNLKTGKKAKKGKILFVLTSHGQLGDTGDSTGYYLSEVSHPWYVLKNAGYEIDFVTPKGGTPPMVGVDLKDSINNLLLKDSLYQIKIKNTMEPKDVKISNYKVIYYAGGHGTMWDFPDNEELANITSKIYEKGGIVAGVCHGPSGLVNVKLSNGKYLVEGKRVNSFTNEEEENKKLDRVVPFMLETKLIERGARFEKSLPFNEHVTIDGTLITGQNPASAKKVGEEILKLIRIKKL